MKFLLIASLFAVGAIAGTSQAGLDYRVFESIPAAPAPWVVKEDADIDLKHSIKLRIHLKNRDVASFQQKVMDISTPDHPTYGRHMTQDEINGMISPSKNAFDSVLEWIVSLQLEGKARVENDWVILTGTLEDAEKLLQTKYQLFENPKTGKLAARTLSYSIPEKLHAHVDLIAPTIKFPTMAPEISTLHGNIAAEYVSQAFTAASSDSDVHDGLDVVACNSTITPACLEALYKFKHFRASRRNGNEIALAGFLEQYAQHDDLDQFIGAYAPDQAGANFSTVLVNGGLNTQDNDSDQYQKIGEANLDVQYGLSLAYPTPSTYFSTAGRPPEVPDYEVDNEPYLEFLTHLLSLKKIPQVISISYGDAEWTVPRSYAYTVCDLFAQVAARGVTFLASSGDGGSGSDCSVTDPTKLLYTPIFPASCPWITAVGGTRYVEPEQAVSFSGGGFSDIFPRPPWQSNAVNAYITAHPNPAFRQYYNISGRAYPDVSAQGVYYHTILNGTDRLLSGTSASAPTFAAVVALLNSDRISNGLPVFGFLNPWIYSKGVSGLVDITAGKQSGCWQVLGSGFQAVAGWDPVTGLGTPNFKKLRFASTGIQS